MPDDNLAEQLLVLEPVFSESPRKPHQRLNRLPGAWVRVPLSWLTQPPRNHVFGPKERLFLLLLYRSHWGQRGVKLTSAIAAEIGILPRMKQRWLLELERDGWVRVERKSHATPIVWPIVITG